MSMNKAGHIDRNSRNCRGIVLLVTLVLLVVLSTLGYTLTSRIAAQRHRNSYIIDYCKARYACHQNPHEQLLSRGRPGPYVKPAYRSRLSCDAIISRATPAI